MCSLEGSRGRGGQSPPSWPPRPGQPHLRVNAHNTYLKGRTTQKSQLSHWLGGQQSHRPVALGGGSRKGAAGLVASQARSHSCGCPSLALPEGTCVHTLLGPPQPPRLGVARASVGLVSGQRGWLHLSWGDVSPPLCRPAPPREVEAPWLGAAQGRRCSDLGIRRVIARLRRRDCG